MYLRCSSKDCLPPITVSHGATLCFDYCAKPHRYVAMLCVADYPIEKTASLCSLLISDQGVSCPVVLKVCFYAQLPVGYAFEGILPVP